MLKNKLLSAMGGAPANYIEDVFQTWLYTGNGSTQTITNGIDLAGKGGLVWLKPRNAPDNHVLWDTSRGATKGLISNNTDAEFTQASGLTSFGSTGFTVGTGQSLSSTTYASWTFREQPKFFDVVTYTGNGTNRTIAHNLGSVPGCIIVKRTDTVSDWQVYHRSLGTNGVIKLNSTDAAGTSLAMWNNTAPTSTVFSVGTPFSVNESGGTYVAYLFAHNAGGFGLSGTDNVITCGSYTGTGADGNTVTLGYEPQWLLIKNTSDGSAGSNWTMADSLRGQPVSTTQSYKRLLANAADMEEDGGVNLNPTATGFIVQSSSVGLNQSGNTYIYIAIRRGPMKVPTTGTSVFKPQVITANGAINAGFPSDSTLTAVESSLRPWPSRLTGGRPVYTNNTNAESGSSFYNYGFSQNSYDYTFGTGSFSRATMYDFRRAPGFFDVVCYTGTGVAGQTYSHNLSAVPELMIIKRRDSTGGWDTYSAALASTEYLSLNTTDGKTTGTNRWNSTRPTSAVLTVGTAGSVNGSGATYVAYLFATCPRVSKVGSFTGTGSSQIINCGFTSGARFVLIKRTDGPSGWYVWDSARGISSSSDPYLFLNNNDAEITSTNWVDTDSTGFRLTNAGDTEVNILNVQYIFLAIA